MYVHVTVHERGLRSGASQHTDDEAWMGGSGD